MVIRPKCQNSIGRPTSGQTNAPDKKNFARDRGLGTTLIKRLVFSLTEAKHTAFDAVGTQIMICQLAAFLEVVHPMLGLVRTGIVAPLAQVRVTSSVCMCTQTPACLLICVWISRYTVLTNMHLHGHRHHGHKHTDCNTYQHVQIHTDKCLQYVYMWIVELKQYMYTEKKKCSTVWKQMIPFKFSILRRTSIPHVFL